MSAFLNSKEPPYEKFHRVGVYLRLETQGSEVSLGGGVSCLGSIYSMKKAPVCVSFSGCKRKPPPQRSEGFVGGEDGSAFGEPVLTYKDQTPTFCS